jgi:hypothetical protein
VWDYYAHTQGGEAVLKWNNIHTNGNMPLLLRNAVRKGKRSKWEHWHRGETPQSQHQHQMLVGDRERTSTKQSKGCLHWQIVWCVQGLMNHPIHEAATNVELLRTHTFRITTPTPDVSRRPRANLHQATQWLPPLANGLVGEGPNEASNS